MKTFLKLSVLLLVLMSFASCTPNHKELRKQSSDLEKNLLVRATKFLGGVGGGELMCPNDKLIFDQLKNFGDSAKAMPEGICPKLDSDIVVIRKISEMFSTVWVEKELDSLPDNTTNSLEALNVLLTNYKHIKDANKKLNALELQKEVIKVRWVEKEEEYFGNLAFFANHAWNHLYPNLKHHGEEIYKGYEEAVDKLPESFFDAAKIKDILQVPYTDQKVLVTLFKASLKEKLNSHKESYMNKICELNSLFEKLAAIHSMFDGKYRDDKGIYRLIKEIRPMLDMQEEMHGNGKERTEVETVVKIVKG